MIAFFSELVSYIIKLIIFASVAVGGVFLGRNISQNRRNKKEQEDQA